MDGKVYLALDVGSKRIGLAVGSVMPFGRGVIGADDPKIIEKLADIIARELVEEIIIGLPEVKDKDISESYRQALYWKGRLEKQFSLPVRAVNEAFSSRAAEQELRTHGVDTAKDKGRIDERSAELILAQYLSELPE